MKLSKLAQWVGLWGLGAVLGGCVVVSDDEGSTIADSGPVPTTGNTSGATGTDGDTGTDDNGEDSSGAADTTTSDMVCDPPCAEGEVCVMGTCFDDGMSDSSTGDPPPTNSDYGPCDSCAAGETPVGIQDVEGCFCAPACDGAGSMCPAPNEGTAVAVCALELEMGAGPTLCALGCDPAMMDMCPPGATCQDTGMGGGLCTHPSP